MSAHQRKIYDEVADERDRQNAKFGQQDHPDGTGDEMFPTSGGFRRHAANNARHACQEAFAKGQGTWRHVLEEEVREAFAEIDSSKLREELLQVAAVAVAWVEAIDRRSV